MTRIPNLKNLLFLSSYLTNRIDYLQGAGGNISEKIDGDVMAIKSSGVEIKQMNQNFCRRICRRNSSKKSQLNAFFHLNKFP